MCKEIIYNKIYTLNHVVTANKRLTNWFFCRRIPNVTVSTDEGDLELEISDDPHDCRRLDVASIPVTVTMSKVQ